MLDDKYRVEHLLAMGGMGAVYLGTHTKLRKRVAIKILNPQLNSKAMVERFHREAITASQIGHEGIAQVTDLSTSSDGEPFLVMEYLEGESLGARLEASGPLSVEAACEIGCGILAPLAAAHQAGIVHRDLKPDNVFLVRRSRGEMVKLLDFGISRMTSREGEFRLTKTGLVLGTPYYMSPEQARGESEVSQASDIYSVGVILYEMLTGRVPIQGDNYNELMYRVLTGEYERPRALRSDLPAELERLILQAMAMQVAHRPASAGALEHRLLAFCRPTFRAVELERLAGAGVEPSRADSSGEIELPGRISQLALDGSKVNWGGATHPDVSAATPAPAPVAEAARSGERDSLAESVAAALAPRKRRWLAGAAVVTCGAIAATVIAIASRPGNGNGDRGDRGDLSAHGSGVAPPVEARPAPTAPSVPTSPPGPPAPPAPSPSKSATQVAAPPAPEITLQFSIEPARAAISLDDAPVKGGAITVPRDDAPHRLRITAPGYAPHEQDVRFGEDQTLRIRLERGARPAQQQVRPRPPKGRPDQIEIKSPYDN